MLILASGESNVSARNEKTALQGGSFEGVRSSNSLHLGNRVWHDRATEYPISLAAFGPINQAPRANPLLPPCCVGGRHGDDSAQQYSSRLLGTP